jgi:hypothetical protein
VGRPASLFEPINVFAKGERVSYPKVIIRGKYDPGLVEYIKKGGADNGIPTTIKHFPSIYSGPFIFGIPLHCWVSTAGGLNYGFYPPETGELTDINKFGQIYNERERDHLFPDSGFVACASFPLVSPCEYDILKFNNCIKSSIFKQNNTLFYFMGGYDCRHWSVDKIRTCLRSSKW